ncbi:MAG TPA: hypothetical protein VGO40_16855 [Longimicrobium sp.]|jgi:hypothetical protein|nr:hypothetical protein [Longimicrobium sp.]
MTPDEKIGVLEDDERFSLPELGEDGFWRVVVSHPNRNATLTASDYDAVIEKAWKIREELNHKLP